MYTCAQTCKAYLIRFIYDDAPKPRQLRVPGHWLARQIRELDAVCIRDLDRSERQ